MKNQKGFTVTELTIIVLFIITLFGYVMNIVKLLQSVDTVAQIISDGSVMVLIRIIGIVLFPLGVVMGFIPS
jgi:hypothetical protein